MTDNTKTVLGILGVAGSAAVGAISSGWKAALTAGGVALFGTLAALFRSVPGSKPADPKPGAMLVLLCAGLIAQGCGDLNEDAAPYISGGATYRSLNWAGEVIVPHVEAAGACKTFVVPNYSTGSAIGHKVGHWVGLGGGGPNCNLIQAGVLAQRTFAGINRNFFWQFWPGAFHQSGMSVASGQQVSMCAERLPNGHGRMTLWNDSLGIAEVHDEGPVGSNCSSTVEWVTERVPNGSGGLAPVLAFSQFQDFNIWAWDVNGNVIPVNAAQSGGVDPDIYASAAVGSAKLVDASFIESNATQVTTWNQAQ